MPQAIPMIAMAVATAMEVELVTMIVVAVASSLTAGALQQAMTDEPSMPQLGVGGVRDMTHGLRANPRSAIAPLPILYGKLRVGGNIVFMESAGTDNKDLWIVQNLSEGECEGIVQDGGTDQVFLGNLLYDQYGGNVDYWFHSGTSSQTKDTNLNSAIAKWTDNQRNTCYIVYKFVYDKDYFQSLPLLTILLKGRKLFDFRDDSTAYSANAVLALYDFMTSCRYGRGLSSDKFDIASWTSAANYCDTKGWEINMLINDTNKPAEDIEDAICRLFRGQKVWWDGKWYLRYADLNYESSVMTIDDEHISQNPDGRADVRISQPSLYDYPDGIRVRFIDAEKGWVEDSIMIGDATGVVKELILEGCTDREHASNIGVYALERMQLDRGISGVFRDDALQLEPHDVITFNSTALAISSQLMRVVDATILGSGRINLSLQYEDVVLYNDDYDLDVEGIYTCDLPDPTDPPPSVANVSISEETYDYRLRTFTKLKVSFDDPADYPWFDFAEVWLSYDDATYEHVYNVTDDFEIANAEEGRTYYVKLRSVSIHGVKQTLAGAYKLSKTVLGYTDEPESLSGLDAVVNQNCVNLYSAKVDDPDIELYEFRLGTSWSGSIFLAALRSPNLSLFGVKPGNHTFQASTLSNNGEYGATPQSEAVSLKDPPDGWAVQNTETDDYTGGTHDNTEHTTYDGDDYLKCSHDSTGLIGIYTSPIYDRGASGRYMVYVLGDIVVTGAGTTWDDIIPTPDTWDDVEIDTLSWSELFELSAGPQVKMKLKYGETSPPTNEVEKMEILSTIVTGRYFQVEIEITDPSAEVNALVENFTLKFCQ